MVIGPIRWQCPGAIAIQVIGYDHSQEDAHMNVVDDDFDLELEKMAQEELGSRFLKLSSELEELEKAMRSDMIPGEKLNELTRSAHNLKAMAGYAREAAVAVWCHECESVLSSLSKGELSVDDQFLSWLQGVKEQLKEWTEQLEEGQTELIRTKSPETGAVIYSIETLGDVLQNCTVLLIEGETPKIAYLKNTEAYLGKSLVVGSFKEALAYAKSKVDENIILVSDAVKDKKLLLQLIHAFAKEADHVPILVMENLKLPPKYRQQFLQAEWIDFFLEHPPQVESLEHAIGLVAGNRFMEKTIKLGRNDDILKYITALAPLPNSVRELNRLRSDPNATLREVSDVITKDPALSSKILQMVGSAAMGLSHSVTSTHQAITLLGKERVLAIAMQSDMSQSLQINLSPYGLDENKFYDTSIRRMNLMMHWFMKVALSKVGLLTTAALIANIGQVVISRVVSRQGKSLQFLKLVQEKGAKRAELEMVHATAELVTVDVLTHWQLDPEIIGALKYCSHPDQAPQDFRQEALALYVVNQTILAETPKVEPRLIERMASEVSLHQMNPTAFRKAVEKVTG